jgi:hypothetical protein
MRSTGDYPELDSKDYLPLYLNELSFRFNNRKNPVSSMNSHEDAEFATLAAASASKGQPTQTITLAISELRLGLLARLFVRLLPFRGRNIQP